MDPKTNPVYNTPITTADGINTAVAQQVTELQSAKSNILYRVSETVAAPTTDPTIDAEYDALNTGVQGARKTEFKAILNSVADNLTAIGYQVDSTTADPTVGACTLYPATGFTDTTAIGTALDAQCADMVMVLGQLANSMTMSEMTTSVDPRIVTVFTQVSSDEQAAHRARIKQALYVYADNLRTIATLWA